MFFRLFHPFYSLSLSLSLLALAVAIASHDIVQFHRKKKQQQQRSITQNIPSQWHFSCNRLLFGFGFRKWFPFVVAMTHVFALSFELIAIYKLLVLIAMCACARTQKKAQRKKAKPMLISTNGYNCLK